MALPAKKEGNFVCFLTLSLSGWVRVALPVATRETKGNIAFSFRDTECPWWKGGVLFDFIELKKMQ